ncbi:MAG: hypothetical protein WC777_01455 [Candidatus Gracilibacteria bacterium]|jgi:hypothetical protein
MNVEQEITDLKARNLRVEADKAWETSWTRRLLIVALTYGVVVLFFFAADLPNPFVNAIVPVIGFTLSTFSVSFIKTWWMRSNSKK